MIDTKFLSPNIFLQRGLRDDPSYFPQPDVPNNGNYGSSFGRERLYYDYLPRLASIDTANAAAGEKTYSSGKYTFNPATGQYTWDPAVLVAAKSGAGSGINAGSDTGGPGGNDGQSSNPGWDDMSDAQKAAFYDSHPNFQAVTKAGQKALGFLGLTDAKQAAIAGGTLGLSGYNNFGKESTIPSGGIISPGVTANDYGKSSWGKTGSAEQDIGPAAPGGTAYGGGSGRGSGGAQGAHADTGTGALASGADAVADIPSADIPSADVPSADVPSADVPSADGEANGGMIGHYSQGGLGSLGGYSDGGRLLRGPGDGVSDSIPATVGGRQPARLADGEFVVPARIVSELGNGSTEAGARALYKMMDRIQANRRKTTGKNSVAVNSKSHKYLPA